MLEALVTAGIRADMVVGASVGAINAAYSRPGPRLPGGGETGSIRGNIHAIRAGREKCTDE